MNDDGPSARGTWLLLSVAASGVETVRRAPLRNAATAACVAAMLLPYLVGVGIARGLADQIADSAAGGADLYVDGVTGGAPAPLSSDLWSTVAAVDGVAAVTPRIVAPLTLGRRDEPVVLVGLPPDALPADSAVVDGRLPSASASDEVVLGSVVARRLALEVGSAIPPFYRSSGGEKVTTVVGVFTRDAPAWQSHLMLTTLETAARMVDRPDAATDLLVTCEPGRDPDRVAVDIRRIRPQTAGGHAMTLRVTTRTDVSVLGLRDVLHAEGLYHALFALVFATGIPIVLVTSGVGLRERRQETGLLRATGWRADEVLLRSCVENVTVATIAGGAAIALAWLWLDALDGWGIAPVFFPGAAPSAGFAVPFRLTPFPVLLGFSLAYVLVLIGTVPATWRAASVPPARAME